MIGTPVARSRFRMFSGVSFSSTMISARSELPRSVRASAAKHGGQDLMHVLRQRARERVLEAFAAGRWHVVRPPPDQNLLLAPFLAGVVLVEAGQITIVAFVQRQIPDDRKFGLTNLGQHQIQRVLGT